MIKWLFHFVFPGWQLKCHFSVETGEALSESPNWNVGERGFHSYFILRLEILKNSKGKPREVSGNYTKKTI